MRLARGGGGSATGWWSHGSASRGLVVRPGGRAGWPRAVQPWAWRPRGLALCSSAAGVSVAWCRAVQLRVRWPHRSASWSSAAVVGRSVHRSAVAVQASCRTGSSRSPGRTRCRSAAITRVESSRIARLRHPARPGPSRRPAGSVDREPGQCHAAPTRRARGLIAARPHPETPKTRPAMPRGGSSKVARNGFRLSKPARCTSRPAPDPAGPARPTPRGTPSAATAARHEGARRADRGTRRRRSRARRAR